MRAEYIYQTLVALAGESELIYVEENIYLHQYYVTATMFNLAVVVAFAWTSPSLPKLMAPGSPVRITTEQGTWIVSYMKLGLLVAPFPAAWMMDR